MASAAPVAAVVRSPHGEQHELLRILDGQEPQQNLVEEGKNSMFAPMAQSQSQDGYDRKAGSSCEHAEGVFQIAKYGIKHPMMSCGVGLDDVFGHRNPSGS